VGLPGRGRDQGRSGPVAAPLLSYDGASLVLQNADGGLTVLNRAEVRQIGLRELPKGLNHPADPRLAAALGAGRGRAISRSPT